LRHPEARSNLEEMVGDTNFLRYLPEPSSALVAPEEVKRHILCSGALSPAIWWNLITDNRSGWLGQVYFALTKAREERGITDIAISRIEQLSPFPYDLVRLSFFILLDTISH
jgi:2-oxoglutarate dehydrogenase E1 component